MTPDEVSAYALGKPGAWADQPWEDDDVAKVGDKIFAFLGAGGPEGARVGVKLGSRAEADEWIAEFPDDASVSPYIGRHGWNTLAIGGAIPDEALREAIDTSYQLVVTKLPRSQRPDSSSSSSS